MVVNKGQTLRSPSRVFIPIKDTITHVAPISWEGLRICPSTIKPSAMLPMGSKFIITEARTAPMHEIHKKMQ